MTTLNEFLKNDIFKLPLNYSGDFQKFLKDLLVNKFLTKIETLKEEELDSNSFMYPIDFIKETQRKFVYGLLETVSLYFEGKPNRAYEKFSNTIRSDLKDFDDILNFKEVDRNVSFYRIRLSASNYQLDKSELFHIPFEKRGNVKSQRFSIPGFPSLYLGTSIYICWEEMNRPLRNEFQVVRLENKSPLKILDLSPLNTQELLDKKKLYRYFMTWPLIALCSIKVSNKDDTFKPEYILPQILLEWISDNHSIDGLFYQTTHIDFDKVSTRGELTNAVFPVLSSNDNGICPELAKRFKITQPFSLELIDFIEGFPELRIEDINGDIDPLDLKIKSFEILKGKTIKYSDSIFGEMEKYLEKEPLYEIL
ncbi:hypothetical protein ACE01N_16095 [Saccharicrinis sp. FJH2]|uniref:hypothetical protein n=1 Tax=Saccharicrinis sp. FJH65 TaxID=3344659 RepID=UPI0035F29981